VRVAQGHNSIVSIGTQFMNFKEKIRVRRRGELCVDLVHDVAE
jgi:hypothetical protein